MSSGRNHSRRHQAARQHARYEHTCPVCGRTIRWNGYRNHRRACDATAILRDAADKARSRTA